MILVGGLPGAGKSTVSGLAADRLGAVLLATDRLRKEISGVSPLTRMTQPYRRGLYDTEHTHGTYRELLHRAERLLSTGESVVLDGSWTNARLRRRATLVAARVNAQLVEVEYWASPAVRRARLVARTSGMSDADEQIAGRMAAEADPWPTAFRLVNTGSPQVALDNCWMLSASTGRATRLKVDVAHADPSRLSGASPAPHRTRTTGSCRRSPC